MSYVAEACILATRVTMETIRDGPVSGASVQ